MTILKTAYLNICIKHVKGSMPSAVVVDVNIHSSPPSQLSGAIYGGVWTNVLSYQAQTFQEAHDTVVDLVSRNPHLSFLGMWLEKSESSPHDLRLIQQRGVKE